MGATTDTCADMSWVLGDECGTVVRGLCQWPVFQLRVELQCSVSVTIFVLVVLSVSVSVSTFGCVFGFGFGSVCCHVACCLLLAFVHGSLYFSFGYVFCPRHAGIMLLEGGLTGNSYGLQRMSHL